MLTRTVTHLVKVLLHQEHGHCVWILAHAVKLQRTKETSRMNAGFPHTPTVWLDDITTTLKHLTQKLSPLAILLSNLISGALEICEHAFASWSYSSGCKSTHRNLGTGSHGGTG